MKSLIVGMGIGGLYKSQLEFLGATVTTVDSNPAVKADYLSIQDIPPTEMFDTAHICTPNFLHDEHARLCAPLSTIVFVDKPGVKTAGDWHRLTEDFPTTRFMMVKNNQWREQIAGLSELAHSAKTINIIWNNCDRVPKPGSWFTTKALAYGGVSRDLMPHLLSWVQALFPEDSPGHSTWKHAWDTSSSSEQWHKLCDLTGSDYGEMFADGVYDVDDRASMQLMLNGKVINLQADWRTGHPDARYLELVFEDDTTLRYEFGLCPEYAYRRMIQEAHSKVYDVEFWKKQMVRDMWIHTAVGKFK